jgi:hypothetical protein
LLLAAVRAVRTALTAAIRNRDLLERIAKSLLQAERQREVYFVTNVSIIGE